MDLSPLEEAFLGDLAQDRHGLWEVFAFVRLHLPDASEDEVTVGGRDLVCEWVRRGWVQIEKEDGTQLDTPDLERAIWSSIRPPPVGPVSESFWLTLTNRARSDLPWLGPAA